MPDSPSFVTTQDGGSATDKIWQVSLLLSEATTVFSGF
jgi:hypothetical protein